MIKETPETGDFRTIDAERTVVDLFVIRSCAIFVEAADNDPP